MIPKSNWGIEAYPREIRFFFEEKSISLELDLSAPIKEFTLQLDLEKDVVRVFGRAKEGYFHFEIFHEGKKIVTTLKRGHSIPYSFAGKKGVLERHQFLEIETERAFEDYQLERLSLGVTKKLDWEMVIRRGELKEILPILFFLGQKVDSDLSDSSFSIDSIQSFIKAHFDFMLVPKRSVEKRIGTTEKDLPEHIKFSAILYKCYEHIRSFFLKEEKGAVFIFPNLPKEFIYGKLVGLKTSKAIIDIEWTKRRVRKVRVVATGSGVLEIKWPKDIDSFRLKNRPHEKGKMVSSSDDIILSPGQIYYLDKFQK
ncbi:MAG: hypothetical protein FJZ59_03880 [Chlamydiae bacterium]|nr:hypothetical protein [Chlamydiota bacterium]